MKITTKHSIVAIGVVITVVSLFTIQPVAQYQTVMPQVQDISNQVDFTSAWYPPRYVKIDLGSNTAIKKIAVKEGQTVKKGAVLAQLDDSAEKAQLASAQSAFNAAAASRNSLQALQKQVASSLASLEKSITLVPPSAQQTYASTIKSLGTINLTSSLQQGINAAATQITSAQQAVDAKKIKAPFSGTILYIGTGDYGATSSSSTSSLGSLSSLLGSSSTSSLGSLSALGGSSTASTSPVASNGITFSPRQGNSIILADMKQYRIIATFSEQDIVTLKPGMKVAVTARSVSNTLTGTVSKVYLIPNDQNADSPLYYAEMTLDTIPTTVPLGAKLDGTITTAEKQQALTIPYDAITFEPNNQGSIYVLENGQKVQKTVTVGIIGTNSVELTSGVDQNTKIIVDILPSRNTIQLRPWLKTLLNIR